MSANVVLAIKLTPQQRSALERIAKRQKVTLSDVAREALKDLCKAEGVKFEEAVFKPGPVAAERG